jgi:hypothetical protein
MRARRFILTTLAALYFGALMGLAFVPGSASNRAFWFWPFAAFVPVGLMLVLLLGRRRWWAAIVFGMLGAAWLEAAQSVWMPPGYAESMDVLWASLGVVVGVGAGVAIRALSTVSRGVPMRVHESPRIVPHPGRREIPQD